MTTEKRLEKRWQNLLRDCMKRAREMGAKDPQIYIECDSGLVVLDGSPHEDIGLSSVPRQDRILFELPWPSDAMGDVGAW